MSIFQRTATVYNDAFEAILSGCGESKIENIELRGIRVRYEALDGNAEALHDLDVTLDITPVLQYSWCECE
jgi:hypothetical protein